MITNKYFPVGVTVSPCMCLAIWKAFCHNSGGHEEVLRCTCIIYLIKDQMCSDSWKNMYSATRCPSIKSPVQGNKYAAVVCSLSLKSISRQSIFINFRFCPLKMAKIFSQEIQTPCWQCNYAHCLVTLLKAVFIHLAVE